MAKVDAIIKKAVDENTVRNRKIGDKIFVAVIDVARLYLETPHINESAVNTIYRKVIKDLDLDEPPLLKMGGVEGLKNTDLLAIQYGHSGRLRNRLLAEKDRLIIKPLMIESENQMPVSGADKALEQGFPITVKIKTNRKPVFSQEHLDAVMDHVFKTIEEIKDRNVQAMATISERDEEIKRLKAEIVRLNAEVERRSSVSVTDLLMLALDEVPA